MGHRDRIATKAMAISNSWAGATPGTVGEITYNPRSKLPCSVCREDPVAFRRQKADQFDSDLGSLGLLFGYHWTMSWVRAGESAFLWQTSLR